MAYKLTTVSPHTISFFRMYLTKTDIGTLSKKHPIDFHLWKEFGDNMDFNSQWKFCLRDSIRIPKQIFLDFFNMLPMLSIAETYEHINDLVEDEETLTFMSESIMDRALENEFLTQDNFRKLRKILKVRKGLTIDGKSKQKQDEFDDLIDLIKKSTPTGTNPDPWADLPKKPRPYMPWRIGPPNSGQSPYEGITYTWSDSTIPSKDLNKYRSAGEIKQPHNFLYGSTQEAVMDKYTDILDNSLTRSLLSKK